MYGIPLVTFDPGSVWETQRAGVKSIVTRGWKRNTKGRKTRRIFGTQPKARARWPTRLRSVRATTWGDFGDHVQHFLDKIALSYICDRDPFVEGSRNKHWWLQVEAGMCSAMQQKITIMTLKHRAKMLDARGVQRTSIGFFESSARGEAAYDGVKAAQRAHDGAKAAENVANLRATQQLQILATYIDKLDSTMRQERQQYNQLIRSCRDN